MELLTFGRDVTLRSVGHLVHIPVCLNLKKVDTFGNNTKSKNETKDTDTTSVQ